MNERNKSGAALVLAVFDIMVALFLWVVLIVLKACGVLRMHWALVLSGIVWITWGLFALTALAVMICRSVPVLKKKYRRRKIDRRIRRQVKALGLSDAVNILGGRALEMKAEEYGIVRGVGETDQELRRRLLSSAEWDRVPEEWDRVPEERDKGPEK